MSIEFDSTIDFQKKISATSSYKYKRVLPIGGQGQSVATSLTSSVQTQFEIPSNCINLSKTKLKFNLLLPDPGASPIFNWIEANLNKAFDRIT